MKIRVGIVLVLVGLTAFIAFLYRTETARADLSNATRSAVVSGPPTGGSMGPIPAGAPIALPIGGAATTSRASIWDARDIRAAAEVARQRGTAGEKFWAAGVFRECYAFAADESKESPEVKALREKNEADESSELKRRKEAAVASLADRCKGLKELSAGQRREMTAALRSGAVQSENGKQSTIQALDVLESRLQRGDSHWSAHEEQTVTDALYSEDPIVRRTAFLLLSMSIDENVPGGRDRRSALLFSKADEYVNRPLSTFETLERCAILGQCGDGDAGSADGTTSAGDSPNINRLKALYRGAFASRRSSYDIMAIR